MRLLSFLRDPMARHDLLQTASRLRQEHWRLQRAAGIDIIPSNDFSLYDQMLDHICLFGCVPARYLASGRKMASLDEYFAMARGDAQNHALEMTKWLDTNYHYLVPELAANQEFQLAATKPFDKLALLPKLLPVYVLLLQEMRKLGLIDGRNVWKNDFAQSLASIEKAKASLGASRLLLAPSCSLLHCPHGLQGEKTTPPEVIRWLAFAEEYQAQQADLENRKQHPDVQVAAVRDRIRNLSPDAANRHSPYAKREMAQQKRLRLPAYPTTTIGSFPQTEEVRRARAQWKSGQLSDPDYRAFLEAETRRAVVRQEELGLDVLVQSYGSRCVKGHAHRPGDHPEMEFCA